ncbi:transcriptional regulator [Candidatus Bipolaricaulota sp. J31]
MKEKIHIEGWRYLGFRTVEIDKIVGSVDRYQDFTRAFLPLRADRDRLRRIKRAMDRNEIFPPVRLYKVGDIYFVEDGHHRVAAAKERGAKFIDAEVTEFIPNVPLEPGITEVEILIKAEYSEFLRQTKLDKLRPEARIEFTELGKYRILLEHIEVHRYFRAREEGREIPFQEAVLSWYDNVYKPLVEAFRRSRILDYFPGRTEADLYLWVSEHLHHLRQTLGGGVGPKEAVEDFVDRLTALVRGSFSQTPNPARAIQ